MKRPPFALASCCLVLIVASAPAGPDAGPSKEPFFGIEHVDLSKLTPEDAASLGVPIRRGQIVKSVIPDSPAERAGIRQNDIVHKAGETSLDSEPIFKKWLSNTEEGKKYPVFIYRPTPRTGRWERRTLTLTMEFREKTKPAATEDGDDLPGLEGPALGGRTPGLPPKPKGLTATLQEPVVYIAKGDTVRRYRFCNYLFDGERSTEGYFKVDGKTHRARLISADPSKVAIVNLGEEGVTSKLGELFRFTSPGRTVITVKVGDIEKDLPIKVVELPFPIGSPSAKVIEALGLPDAKRPIDVDWPDTEMYDSIIYSPKAGESFSGEHWRYKDLPGAALSIMDGKLHRVGSNSTGKDDDF
jgi:hypothetical protein